MNIDELIKIATLEKNVAAKEAFRAIKAELLLNNSSKNPKPEGKIVKTLYKIPFKYIEEGLDSPHRIKVEINELDLSIIKKQIQIREEQINMYDANSRKDLADIYREQNKLLELFLPPEISKDKIQEFVTTSYPNGYTQKEMGKVIKEVKNTYPTADNKIIAEIVKQYIL